MYCRADVLSLRTQRVRVVLEDWTMVSGVMTEAHDCCINVLADDGIIYVLTYGMLRSVDKE